MEHRETETDAELKRFLSDRDVACPGCGYNLRELATASCPECNTPLRLQVATSHSRRFARGLFAACMMYALMAWMSAAEFAWYLLGMYGVIGSSSGRGFVRLRAINWFTTAHTFIIGALCVWVFITAWRARRSGSKSGTGGWVLAMVRGLIVMLVIDGVLGCVTFVWGWLLR